MVIHCNMVQDMFASEIASQKIDKGIKTLGQKDKNYMTRTLLLKKLCTFRGQGLRFKIVIQSVIMHCFALTFIYILFATLPTTLVFLSIWRGHPSEWLQKRSSHRLCELSYLEVGLGSQSIHMEFDMNAAAYTLLVRDSARCEHFFNRLTGRYPPSHIHIHLHVHSCKYRAHVMVKPKCKFQSLHRI